MRTTDISFAVNCVAESAGAFEEPCPLVEVVDVVELCPLVELWLEVCVVAVVDVDAFGEAPPRPAMI